MKKKAKTDSGSGQVPTPALWDQPGEEREARSKPPPYTYPLTWASPQTPMRTNPSCVPRTHRLCSRQPWAAEMVTFRNKDMSTLGLLYFCDLPGESWW